MNYKANLKENRSKISILEYWNKKNYLFKDGKITIPSMGLME